MEKIKLFLQKPLYKSIKVWHVLVVLIVLASFGESETKKTEQDEITVNVKEISGDWYSEKSKVMGGYKITMKEILTITETSSGFEYEIESTVIDEMYGGNPKTSIFNGIIKNDNSNKKLILSGSGSYAERGAYIVVPKDNWEEGDGGSLVLKFAPNKGNTIYFNR
tara:strand:- start:1031 stop:1525 length:495 start_codon:yes stop_codon:yes gene_type:complete